MLSWRYFSRPGWRRVIRLARCRSLLRCMATADPSRGPKWYPRAAEQKPGSCAVLLYFSGWAGTGIDSSAAITDLVPARLRGGYRHLSGESATPHGFLIRCRIPGFHAHCRRARAHAGRRRHSSAGYARSPTGRTQLGLLAQRLNLDRVGVFGYSFGGAVAAETAWMDRASKRRQISTDGSSPRRPTTASSSPICS